MSANPKISRQYLEYQADRIEMVLANHQIPARVEGGAVLPRWLRFNITPGPTTRISKVRNLAEELALALGADDVRVDRDGHRLTVEVPRHDSTLVSLMPLINDLPRLHPYTAVLGLSDAGQPLLIRLNSPDVTHMLIAGTTGSGKTELLRTILASLALGNRQRDLQMVLIDPKHRGLAPFANLPHLALPLITHTPDALDALHRLVAEMLRRDAEGRATPRLVVAIDEVVELLMEGGQPVLDALIRLAQRGREAGIHLIIGAQKPTSQVFGPTLRANFPVRLVGRLPSAQDALAAAGIGGTGAEKLLGRGDFLAIASGQVTRFQSAYIDTAELQQLTHRLRGRAN